MKFINLLFESKVARFAMTSVNTKQHHRHTQSFTELVKQQQ